MKQHPILAALLMLVFSAMGVFAHPMGNFSINHFSALTVEPQGIQVRYILDFAEIPTFQERQGMDQNQDGTISTTEQTRYLEEKVSTLSNRLFLIIDGKRQPLTPLSHTLEFPKGAGGLPTMRLDIVYQTPPVSLHGRAEPQSWMLEYEDKNYPHRVGWKELAAKGVSGIGLEGSIVPETGSALLDYSEAENNTPPQILKTSFSFHRSAGIPPTISAAPRPMALPGLSQEDAFTRLMGEHRPSGLNLFWILIVSAALGAGHALSPGHGKTLVAAYLVGSQGTFRHALLLGITVTFSHTIGVFLLGLITLYLSDLILPETLYPWLSRLSGLGILTIGLILFRQRWAGLKSHTKTSHHHHPKTKPHDAAHPLKHILGLGISGGIIPCPSALVVLLSAVAFHQVGFGMLLITAFSFGLAATLVAVGLSVVYLGNRFKGFGPFGPLFRFLPPVSAASVSILGGLIALGGGG